MCRTVFCSRLKKDLPGLNQAPFPGPRGQDILANVSEQAWLEWQHMQTMLINEKHLNLMDKEARKYLNEQRDKFLAGETIDHIGGYRAPEPDA